MVNVSAGVGASATSGAAHARSCAPPRQRMHLYLGRRPSSAGSEHAAAPAVQALFPAALPSSSLSSGTAVAAAVRAQVSGSSIAVRTPPSASAVPVPVLVPVVQSAAVAEAGC